MVTTNTTNTKNDYSIAKLLDKEGFTLDPNKEGKGKAKDFFNNTNITTLATELATDLGDSSADVQDGILNFIKTQASNVSDTVTVNDFLTDALIGLKKIAGDDKKIQASEFKIATKDTENTSDTKTSNVTTQQSDALAYALLQNMGNDKVTNLIIQLFTVVEQKNADGNVIKGADGKPVQQIAISSQDSQVIINFFKNYGMMDTDPNTMSESETVKLHEALIALKEKLDGLDPDELAKFDLYGFLKEFKEDDKEEQKLDEGLKKLQDSQKKLSDAMKGSLDGLKKMQSSSGQYLKGQTAFGSPF
jgi:hypothetical protein